VLEGHSDIHVIYLLAMANVTGNSEMVDEK